MTDNRPNFLLITTDHWPGALLGAAGHSVIQTPTLDEMAAAGTHFSDAYSACPVCVPARRTLMTGASSRTIGFRSYTETPPMPPLPTLAGTLRDAGYQATAVGKMHTYPPRYRAGFDDVILDEDGRLQYGVVDDYELFLADQGYAGQHFAHGMSSNQYWYRPWHLPEPTHVTNWAANQMARTIARRDPTRPALWYLAFRHPHPPLVPLQTYLDLYRDYSIDMPYHGDWSGDAAPAWVQGRQMNHASLTETQLMAARRAFYALCTHIDHQIRYVIGTLRESGLLDNTIICFSADHGDMLGNHGMYAKGIFYDYSTRVPMILAGRDIPEGVTDDRVVEWMDVMPTLLELAGVEVPETVDGLSMLGSTRRDWLYGEYDEGQRANRMIYDGRYKLIYYPLGNVRQLFDRATDPNECHDLSDDPAHAATLDRLTGLLIDQLYGGDEAWVREGQLVGIAEGHYRSGYPALSMLGQRGIHWPPPPKTVD
jgi:choline-sulfatase